VAALLCCFGVGVSVEGASMQVPPRATAMVLSRAEAVGGEGPESGVGIQAVVRSKVRPGLEGMVASESERSFEFVYEARIVNLPMGEGPVDIFVPLAQSTPRQEVLKRDIQASIPGEVRLEMPYGNQFWHAHLDVVAQAEVQVQVRYRVRRKAFRSDQMKLEPAPVSGVIQRQLELFLKGSRRVPSSGTLVDKVRGDLPPSDGTSLGQARSIYDYVIEHMEYKKVGTGWGNGDTYWACLKKYGNCTDFHALFSSLARAEGLPTRFEIGFPIPEDKPAGDIVGYHCWVDFYVPELGWFPIDASEAWKHPERRDFYFGNLPADRFLFTVGRDLELGDGHTSGPLNFFIYPHVELAGRPHHGVETRFHYR